jgi:hypothetical protein
MPHLGHSYGDNCDSLLKWHRLLLHQGLSTLLLWCRLSNEKVKFELFNACSSSEIV